MCQNLRAIGATIVMLALAAAPSAAEEGMWTFDNFPAARMQAEMGWAPDEVWLSRVMAGTARLPGCSASNVSAAGLVLTNHHCVIACVQALSSTQANYIAAGFMARARAEERRCPAMIVSVLIDISDVTARIDLAAAAAAPDAFARVRNAEMARIEGECSQGAVRCEVVMLYQGGRYALYRYHRYDDVRLVFAPEHAMAAFGGEADNFSFPRYCVDVAFLRLYENGAPAATPTHLSMRFSPLTEGDIVLTAGNPGPTSRLRSSAELAFERDVNLPWRLESLNEVRVRLAEFAALGLDQARVAATALQGIENAQAALAGRRRALVDTAGFAHITARENDLRTRVRRNRAAAREAGDAWGEIARSQVSHRALFYQYQYLELRAGERSELFAFARDIVRGAAEREKPDAERLPRYTQARLAAIAQVIGAERPIDPAFEQVNLELWLSALRMRLGADTLTVSLVLGGEAPDALALRLAGSRLIDPDYRMQMWDGGAVAVAASDDPMIAFVRAWDGEARAVRARFRDEVEAPAARAQERIARARFQAFGESQYPEATFSPRVSYGRVLGWTEADGRTIGAFTDVSGLYERATGSAPFALNKSWIEARARLDGDTQFNLATSNDVIGGNSGSPLLDREGRVVGVVFDGNINALGGEYFYDRGLNRAISVAAPLIRTALTEVYAMDALVAELEE
jgi:hypothetical protein